ncbi:MAG: 30S ribosomal protein S6 [Chitinivibrionales bacterium]|nr:30S ribosomal protein S6 [Chitinivibrionales bacterium]MBD3397147.1 30S ribosomal protein S6 [Chitinivibrionales bacterium]
MKRPYETCIVFDGTLGDDVIEKERQQVEESLKKAADLEQVHPWGRRRLAFEIDRKRNGVYYLFEYQAEGDAVTKLEKQFKLNQHVFRYMTVVRKPGTKAAPPESADKATKTDEAGSDDGREDQHAAER